MPRRVAITGASGYLGTALTVALIERGHDVIAIVRPGSRQRAAIPDRAVEIDVFNVDALAQAVKASDTVVHLIGTPHPKPSKARELQRVDLGSVRACVPACVRANIAHLIYVSVAQPAPLMQSYIDAQLGLVTLRQMVNALVSAVEQPPSSGATRVLGVPEIKAA